MHLFIPSASSTFTFFGWCVGVNCCHVDIAPTLQHTAKIQIVVRNRLRALREGLIHICAAVRWFGSRIQAVTTDIEGDGGGGDYQIPQLTWKSTLAFCLLVFKSEVRSMGP